MLLYALARKNNDLKRAGLGGLILVSLLTIPAYLTGELAEKVEHLPGVSEALSEPHEEAALVAFIALLLTGAFALAALFLSRRRNGFPAWMLTVALLLTGTTVGLMANTANLGGMIRHTEIRAGSTSAPSSEQVGGKDEKKHEEEERKEHK